MRIAATLALLTVFSYGVESRLEIRHREKNGVGYDEGYTSFDYLLTHSWEKPEILGNARAHIFDDARFAANVGIGGRYPIGSCLIGGNFFYDYREFKHFPAHQVGAGIELLNKHVDFRMNGYLPVGTTSHESRKFARFVNHSILVRHKAQAALPLIEAEVGIPITRHCYLAGGPYYLFPRQVHRFDFGKGWGGKVRLDFSTNSPVSLGIAVTHDPIFQTTFQGYLTVRIPIGGSKETPPTRQLRQIPIVRNEIIPIEKKKRTTPLYRDEDSGELVDFLFVNNAFFAEGDGSFEAPFGSLREAEENSQPGDIIYVLPGDGTARNMDEGIVLQDGQVLAGSAAALVVEGVEVPPLTPGEPPAITNIHPDEPVVTNPGESTLEGFHVLEPWEYLLEGWSYDAAFDSASYDVDAGIPSLDVEPPDGGEIVVDIDTGPPVDTTTTETAVPETVDTENSAPTDTVDHTETVETGNSAPTDTVDHTETVETGTGNQPEADSDGDFADWENVGSDDEGTFTTGGANIITDHFQ